MLNWIWAGFFFVAFLAGLFRWLVLGEPGVWAAMVASSFDMAKTGFEVSLGLTPVAAMKETSRCLRCDIRSAER